MCYITSRAALLAAGITIRSHSSNLQGLQLSGSTAVDELDRKLSHITSALDRCDLPAYGGQASWVAWANDGCTRGLGEAE